VKVRLVNAAGAAWDFEARDNACYAMVTKDGRTLARALTFIVQVGEEQLKDESIDSEKAGTSETVITMPAKEEIIR
jgi:hypothetical protein